VVIDLRPLSLGPVFAAAALGVSPLVLGILLLGDSSDGRNFVAFTLLGALGVVVGGGALGW
jgi:hypothetical protein